MTRSLALSEDEARILEELLDGSLRRPTAVTDADRLLRDVYDRLTAPGPQRDPDAEVVAWECERCRAEVQNDGHVPGQCACGDRRWGVLFERSRTLTAAMRQGGESDGTPLLRSPRLPQAPAAPAATVTAEGLDWEAVEEATGEWLVWTPDTSGGVVGAGPTRDAAIFNAVANLRATADAIEPPPAESPPVPPAESPAARDYRLALRALEAEALSTGRAFEAEAAALGRAFAAATHATPLESCAVDLHRAAKALRGDP